MLGKEGQESAIISVLAVRGESSVRDISTATNLPRGLICGILFTLRADGTVRNHGRRWQLTDDLPTWDSTVAKDQEIRDKIENKGVDEMTKNTVTAESNATISREIKSAEVDKSLALVAERLNAAELPALEGWKIKIRVLEKLAALMDETIAHELLELRDWVKEVVRPWENIK